VASTTTDDGSTTTTDGGSTTTVGGSTTTAGGSTTTIGGSTTTVGATTTTTPRSSTTTTSIPPQATGWSYLRASSDHTELVGLVEQADLVAEYEAADATILAPINQAWTDLRANPGGAELLADPVRLRALLLRHVLVDPLTTDQIFALTEVETVTGELLPVDGATRTIDGATIVDGDHANANGAIVQVVDPVLVGPT